MRMAILALALVVSFGTPPFPAHSPPLAVPEFATLAHLLHDRQGFELIGPTGPDMPSAGLIHYQRFGPAVFEEHRDGTIYVAYGPPRSPQWYDVSRAEDLEGPRSEAIRAGRGRKSFGELLRDNLAESGWLPPAQAFPAGRSPQPRWLNFSLPLSDPCAADRHKLAEIEKLLREEPETRLSRLLWEAERPVRRLEERRLTAKVRRPACRPRRDVTWQTLGDRVLRLVPHITEPLASPGDYCYRDVASLDPLKTGPPSWQVILPENTRNGVRLNNGQKLWEPDRPVTAPDNHYVSWQELVALTQQDPLRAKRILRWNGHPTREEITDHRIPWIPSAIDGVVTQSFLSGSDYAVNHFSPPDGYWLGIPGAAPQQWVPCGVLEAVHALCNDWIAFVAPDPEYRFTLTREPQADPGEDAGRGNFTGELQGNLENEVEQWMVPAGYRPEPGDRVHLTGRWVVDCAHDDWHGELHPIESYASAHLLGDSTLASVVVTGDWAGGELNLEVWPAARPNGRATLAWKRERPPVVSDLLLAESLEPPDNPNHLRIHVASTQPRAPLVTGDWGEVAPHPSRRLAVRYRLYWEKK